MSFKFMVAVTVHSDFGAQEKIYRFFPFASTFSPSICREVMGPDAILVFGTLSFKSVFSVSSRSTLVCPHFLPFERYHLHM